MSLAAQAALSPVAVPFILALVLFNLAAYALALGISSALVELL
jgi:hypothetical protein